MLSILMAELGGKAAGDAAITQQAKVVGSQEWPGMTPERMRTELELVTPGGVKKMLNPVMRELAAGWQAQGMALGESRGEARGEARGLTKGKAEGMALGKAEMLKQILHQRFPNKVPRAFERRIDRASLAMIEVWCREVYRVKSVKALAAMTEPEPESDDSRAA